ncbi:MAG: carbon storage regulator [Bryobacteraceae bacterium]|nr:carbon storage regulator [Bryobacteraceae bacterium]
MLVIRRRAGEAIMIGGGIEVRILEAGPNRVKIGVIAPAEVAVVREEVVLARAQNRAAANPTADALEALARGLRQVS